MGYLLFFSWQWWYLNHWSLIYLLLFFIFFIFLHLVTGFIIFSSSTFLNQESFWMIQLSLFVSCVCKSFICGTAHQHVKHCCCCCLENQSEYDAFSFSFFSWQINQWNRFVLFFLFTLQKKNNLKIPCSMSTIRSTCMHSATWMYMLNSATMCSLWIKLFLINTIIYTHTPVNRICSNNNMIQLFEIYSS